MCDVALRCAVLCHCRCVESIQSFTSNLPLVGSLIPAAANTGRSLGLSYHLADIWLPELRRAAGEGALPGPPLAALLEPFLGVVQNSGEAALVARIRCVWDSKAVCASDLVQSSIVSLRCFGSGVRVGASARVAGIRQPVTWSFSTG